ncbi:MAG: glycosyltransferase family 10 domain-containing protein [Alphaproteobacteria bacterium]
MIIQIRFFRLMGLFVVLFFLVQWAHNYQYFLKATFHEFFTPWNFKLPEKGQNFYVKHSCPRAMQRVIIRAFPEYKVVFAPEAPQFHLSLKEYYTPTYNIHYAHVPYLAYSGEQENLRWKRYLPSGYPFMEITSHEKKGDNFIFMPYIVYGKTNLRKLFSEAIIERKNNSVRPLQVAYISSHCIKERNTMFQLLRDRFKDKAISLGKCLQTPGYEAKGTYFDLKGIYKQYNFGLAMENHDRKGYLTEKIANVFEAGSIPIYWGDADLARRFFNPNAFIDIKQYPTFEAAADAVFEIAQDPIRLKAFLDAPLFPGNKIPPFLLINDDHLTDEEEKILQDMAAKLRRSYDSYLKHKQNLKPYWKALEFKELVQEKLGQILKSIKAFLHL